MVPIRRARPVLSFATVCLIVGLTSGPVDFARAGARTDGGAPTGADWPDYGRDAGEAHFSPLSQINSENVSRLGLVSAVDLNVERVNTQPIAVDGVVYVAAGLSIVQAIDARSGRVLWKYDPEVGKVAHEKLRPGWGIRGLAYSRGRLFVGTQDGRLLSLEARNGKVIWSVLTIGENDDRYITGVPRVFNDKVVIGHSGGDVAPTRGYVTCYDTKNGKLLWRFYTIPGDPAAASGDAVAAMAAKTWTGSPTERGGGAVWNAITYDAALNQIYIGVGNGSPWNWRVHNPGGGDALFTDSIVALNADTGKYVWHYQTTPNDAWDFDATADMALAELMIEGRPRQVLMQAPKNGFFYVLDRITGKLISAAKIGTVNWADHIDLATGRPVELAGMRYDRSRISVQPGYNGMHSWAPMSYSPVEHIAFIPVLDGATVMGDEKVDPSSYKKADPGAWNFGLSTLEAIDHRGSLLAWDPLSQKAVWRVTTAGNWSGGTMATAGGLVFQGTLDGQFSAYRARSGQKTWSFYVGGAAISPPISFSIDGKQYVSAIAAPQARRYADSDAFGWNYRTTPRRLLTFSLDAKGSLPPTPAREPVVPLHDAIFTEDEDLESRIGPVYALHCYACHGGEAHSTGGAPDLRASPIPLDSKAFTAVLHDGLLESRGMPRFGELTPATVEDLRRYIRLQANKSAAPPATESHRRP